MTRSIHRNILTWLAALAVPFSVGCVDGGVSDDDSQCEGSKCDHWNDANDPANFGRDYEYDWDELKGTELAHGASDIIPWPDTYWPMTEDGYNQRWLGSSTLSPVEKYDKAFNN